MFAALLLSTPALAAQPFPVALELARRALVVHDDHAAGKALDDAQEAVSQAAVLVPGSEVARLHYLLGVRAWSGGLQSQAMMAWRRMWHLECWEPGDDGLLDDEGMAVLRALQSEGGGEDGQVGISGETNGVLLLRDGMLLRGPSTVYPGAHLFQVRCADGAVSSTWVEVAEAYTLDVGCARSSTRNGGGVNEAVLAEDADEDLLRVALFGAYTTDATMRLAQLPPEAPPKKEAAPLPAPVLVSVETAPTGEPVDDPLACPGETLFVGAPTADGWRGRLATTPERLGFHVDENGSRWFAAAPYGNVSVRVEGEGEFGVRVRYRAAIEDGLAARVHATGVDLVELPGSVVVGREVPTSGRHVLRVDVRNDRVAVRLDDTMLLGGSAGNHDEGTVGIEAAAGAWIGRVSICK